MNRHLGVKPLFLFTYIALLRFVVPQLFIFSAEVQFLFVSSDRTLTYFIPRLTHASSRYINIQLFILSAETYLCFI